MSQLRTYPSVASCATFSNNFGRYKSVQECRKWPRGRIEPIGEARFYNSSTSQMRPVQGSMLLHVSMMLTLPTNYKDAHVFAHFRSVRRACCRRGDPSYARTPLQYCRDRTTSSVEYHICSTDGYCNGVNYVLVLAFALALREYEQQQSRSARHNPRCCGDGSWCCSGDSGSFGISPLSGRAAC